MDRIDILPRATLEFDRRVRLVEPAQYSGSAGMGDWTVRDLIDHVIGGNRMATVLLAGGTRNEAIAAFALSAQDVDLVRAFEQTSAAQSAAFLTPRALEGSVHHPMGDITAVQLLQFRIVDLAVHGWDLAHATGLAEDLDPQTLQAIWDDMSPMASFIGQIGVFGSGPSGNVPTDAPLQMRVLDLSGRRF